MFSLMAPVRLVLKRSAAHWKLLTPVVVGVLLAVSLMTSGVIYSDALEELGLRHALKQMDQDELHFQFNSNYNRGGREYYEKANSFVNDSLTRNIGWFSKGLTRHLKSATFYISFGDQLVYTGPNRPRGFMQSLSGLYDEVDLVSGNLPAEVSAEINSRGFSTSTPDIEAAISYESSVDFGIDVGDRMNLMPYWDDVNSEVTVIVSGIIRPNDPSGEYWLGDSNKFSYPSDDYINVPLFVPEDTLLDGLSPVFPDMTIDYGWVFYIDTSAITRTNAEIALFGLNGLSKEFSSGLDAQARPPKLTEILEDYGISVFFSRIPMLVLIMLVVGIVLYFVAAVSSMLIEAQRGEIALLRSRGSSNRQIISACFIEGIMICVPAAAIGPFIAFFAVKSFGKIPLFASLGGGDWLPATLTKEAFLLACIGSALSLIAFVIPGYHGARGGVPEHKQNMSRPNAKPIYQRYYLDVVVVIFAGLLYWELTERGSFLTKDVFARLGADEVLLVAPAVFIFAIAVIFLRVFPLIVGIISRGMSPIADVSLALGIWHISRNPLHYSRLILLLMLSSSLGVFAASFGPTLERNYTERALYDSGAEIRVHGDIFSNSFDLVSKYQEIPNVEYVSPASRTTGRVTAQLFKSGDYTMFGLDPASFSSVAWYRDDFSSTSFPDLLDKLKQDAPDDKRKMLSENASKIGVWVLPEYTLEDTYLFARLKDMNGNFFDYLLGGEPLSGLDWQFLEADLDVATRTSYWSRRFQLVNPVAPLSFQSFYIRQNWGTAEYSHGSLFIDDLQYIDSGNNVVTLEDFEDISEWHVIESTPDASSDSIAITNSVLHGGESAARFSWASGSSFFIRGVYAGDNDRPISALASDSFLSDTGYSLGDEITIVSQGESIKVNLVDNITYFPSVNPLEESFLVTNMHRLLHNVNLSKRTPNALPNEMWVSTSSVGSDRDDLMASLNSITPSSTSIVDRQDLIEKSSADPLVAAGWTVILFIVFLVTLFLSVLGFLVYSYLMTKRRQLEFAILRTMGISFRQMMSMIWFEHTFIVFLGIAFGTWTGVILGDSVMGFLGITPDGTKVLPPFVIQVNWLAVGVAYSIMAVLFGIIILGVVRRFSKIIIQSVMRMGEE